MATDLINFSVQPLVVTAPTVQPAWSAIEVVGYDEMELLLNVVLVNSASADTKFTLQLETALENREDVPWPSLGIFTPVATSPVFDTRTFRKMLRYVRWRVTQCSASTSLAVTFHLSGVLRSYG